MSYKNILWVSDFNLSHTIGGAQRSDAILINYGRELKYNINEFNYDTKDNFGDFVIKTGPFDLIVSANLEAISRGRSDIFNYLIQAQNHIRLEHDMCRYLSNAERKLLFGNCKKTFFLSQFHYDLFKSSYGDFFQNVEIVVDPIDTAVFYNREQSRSNKILYAGFMHDLKGTKHFFQYALDNPMKSFVVAGWGDKFYEHLSYTVPNVTFLGAKKYEEMPEIYNAYETMFYSPDIPEPFCRSVGEAALCGMKLMVNQKIGCLHELTRLGNTEFIYQCKNAPEIFWNKLCAQ